MSDEVEEDVDMAALRRQVKAAERAIKEKAAKEKHDAAVSKGELDSGSEYSSILDKERKELKEKIAKARRALEIKAMPRSTDFKCIAAAGDRLKRNREVILVVSTEELTRLGRALETQEIMLKVGRDSKSMPESVKQDSDCGDGTLRDYLDACRVECEEMA